MTSLTDNFAALKSHLANLENELADLQKGRKASSTRARKLLQTLKNTSHMMRKQIVEHVKTLPVKARVRGPVQAVEVPQVQAEDLNQPEPVPVQSEDLNQPIPVRPKKRTKKAM